MYLVWQHNNETKATVVCTECSKGNVKPEPETYYNHIKRNVIIAV